MIISEILGGLGNQLFQYAAGKQLAILRNTGLELDLSGFDNYKLRNFDLDAFHTNYKVASETETNQFTQRGFIDKLRDRIGPYSYRRFYRERYFHFDKNFLKYPDNIYLKGYWQSEKYFKQIEEIIRNEFRIKEEFVHKVKSVAADLQNQNSVSIHIRKGDYADSAALLMHGVLPVEYYKDALQIIKNKIKNPVFFIFSDDKAWAKSVLSEKGIDFISGNITSTHYEDFYLMSQCKHNIIANSSFSWWAAWLNNNPDKIVIAPKKWFNKGPKDTQDLIPKGWLRI